MRLILHTAAFSRMWRDQQEIPKATALAVTEIATLRHDAARELARATIDLASDDQAATDPAQLGFDA